MNIRNLIAILVCLGMVAFASSTASAFSLDSRFNIAVVQGGADVLSSKLERLSSGFRVCGSKDDGSGLGIRDIFITTISREGEIISDIYWDGGSDDLFRSVGTDAEDNTYVAVLSDVFYGDRIAKEPVILKIGPAGDLLEVRQIPMQDYTDISISDMAVREDGSIYVWGSAQLIDARLNLDNFLVWHDPHGDGNITWYSRGGGDDVAREIIFDNEYNLITASTYYDRITGDNSVTIRKFAPNGTEIFTSVIAHSRDDDFGGMDVDEYNMIYVATDYEITDLPVVRRASYFTRLNPDGSTDYEQPGDYEGDEEVEITNLIPFTQIWLNIVTRTNAAGENDSVIVLVDKSTLEITDIRSDEENSIYLAARPYDDEGVESNFSGEVTYAVAGRRPSGDGLKILGRTDNTIQIIQTEQLPDFDVIFLSDYVIFMEGELDTGYLGLKVFEATDVYEAPVSAGTNVTATISELGITAVFSTVDTSGYLYAEANPEDSLALPTYFELEGIEITRITTDAGYSIGDNYLSITYDDSSVTDELKLLVLTSEPLYPEGGWITLPIDERSTETNIIVVKVDHFSDFAIGRYLDLPAAIQNLKYIVEGFNLQQGIDRSLDAKLDRLMDALTAANAGNRSDAMNKIQAFINEVEAQSGNWLTPEQADRLINEAYAIMASL